MAQVCVGEMRRVSVMAEGWSCFWIIVDMWLFNLGEERRWEKREEESKQGREEDETEVAKRERGDIEERGGGGQKEETSVNSFWLLSES